mmetsp:Transcript_100748/g.260289  ORF Transcript_100748/g.260289 Transcript_100748/m.260289 type:complete len:300 (+) Transcript_100748:917-1816(+)
MEPVVLEAPAEQGQRHDQAHAGQQRDEAHEALIPHGEGGRLAVLAAQGEYPDEAHHGSGEVEVRGALHGAAILPVARGMLLNVVRQLGDAPVAQLLDLVGLPPDQPLPHRAPRAHLARVIGGLLPARAGGAIILKHVSVMHGDDAHGDDADVLVGRRGVGGEVHLEEDLVGQVLLQVLQVHAVVQALARPHPARPRPAHAAAHAQDALLALELLPDAAHGGQALHGALDDVLREALGDALAAAPDVVVSSVLATGSAGVLPVRCHVRRQDYPALGGEVGHVDECHAGAEHLVGRVAVVL